MKILVNSKLSEHRYKTPEGYLVCVDSVLARTGKQVYRRDELFHDNDATEIEVDRPENEVFSEQTLASFENKPLTIEHPEEDVNPHNYKTYAVGFIRDIKRGTDNGEPVMLGTLVVTDENAIKDIEDGKLPELSCGYDCDIADDDNPQQRNIRGNHVALCEHGRAGNARIVDSVNDGMRKIYQATGRYVLVPTSNWTNYGRNAYYDVDTNDLAKAKYLRQTIENQDGIQMTIVDKTNYKVVDNMNPQEKGAKGLEKQVDKLVNDDEKDVLMALLTKYGFKIVGHGKTWTGRTHIEFTGDYFDEDNRWLVFDKARQKIDRLEAEAKQAGIRMTFNIGTANNNVAGTIDAEQIHDSVKDETVDYAKQLQFKKEYLASRHLDKDAFYFDGMYAVDGDTDMNIRGARLGMDRQELEAILDKHFGIHDSIKDAKYAIKHPKRNLYLTVGAKTWSYENDPMVKKFDSEKEAEEYAKKNTSDFKIIAFDSVNDEFDYEYAQHFKALEQDAKDMYRQWKQYGNKTPSEILAAKGYKDGYGDTMTKKIDKYEYVVDFDDIGYVKYYVRKDGKVPAGWTITKMTFTDRVPDEDGQKANKLVGIIKKVKSKK